MLVIGSNDDGMTYRELDVDPDIDSPKKIYDLLKKTTGGKNYFSHIIVVEDDTVVAQFEDGIDYDTGDDDDSDQDEDDVDVDSLREVDDDEYDDNDDE